MCWWIWGEGGWLDNSGGLGRNLLECAVSWLRTSRKQRFGSNDFGSNHFGSRPQGSKEKRL